MAKSKSKQDLKRVKEGPGAIGTYNEDTGGGEPIWTANRQGEGRGAWQKHDYKESRDPGQPRTDDGKFTYNSANGKPLKEVSKVNGKSRGTTVPPQLTGGVNGIQESNFKKGAEVDEDQQEKIDQAEERLGRKLQEFEGQWYEKGQVVIEIKGKKMTKKFAPMSYIDSMKMITGIDLSNWAKERGIDRPDEEEWAKMSPEEKKKYGWEKKDISPEEKERKISNISDRNFKGQNISKWESKKGRDTKSEKAARQVAKKSGKSQIVQGKGQKRVGAITDAVYSETELANPSMMVSNHKEEFKNGAKKISEKFGMEITPKQLAEALSKYKINTIDEFIENLKD